MRSSPRPFLFLLLAAFVISACAMQRAADAETAQRRMVGMSRAEVFACMGIPKKKANEGDLTIWSYQSTNGHAAKYKKSTSATFSGAVTTALGFGDEVKEKRFCTVQIVMQDDRVLSVNYNGPTGGLLTEDEQCAYAIRNCLP